MQTTLTVLATTSESQRHTHRKRVKHVFTELVGLALQQTCQQQQWHRALQRELEFQTTFWQKQCLMKMKAYKLTRIPQMMYTLRTLWTTFTCRMQTQLFSVETTKYHHKQYVHHLVQVTQLYVKPVGEVVEQYKEVMKQHQFYETTLTRHSASMNMKTKEQLWRQLAHFVRKTFQTRTRLLDLEKWTDSTPMCRRLRHQQRGLACVLQQQKHDMP